MRSMSCLVIVFRSAFIMRKSGGRWMAYFVTRAVESPRAFRWFRNCRAISPFGSCFMLRLCLVRYCS